MIQTLTKSFKTIICLYIIALVHSSVSYAKIIDYKLTIAPRTVNFSGKNALGFSINNLIPGPTLKAKVGDTLRIEVTNNLDTETSIHWHGVLLPNIMDGVPYITSPPIMPGEKFLYEFPVKHTGTFWYHAHSSLQEQQGVYGSLVFYPKYEVKDYDEEHVIVLSDWTDENPDQVLANLKKDPDYYALKKDAVQSWLKVIENGFEAIKIRLRNSWERMGPMDMSDIGYDAFLINGKKSSVLSRAKAGKRIKLRIINAAASSYFVLGYSGGTMKVVEADGIKVDPFAAQKIRIAMAETYDVIITVPDHKTYEIRASAEDGTGFATAHIGDGPLVPASQYPKPNLVLMDMMNHGKDHDMSAMDKADINHSSHQMMNMEHQNSSHNKDHIPYLTNYKSIKSRVATTLPTRNPVRTVTLKLTGSMERYVWTINDTPMYAADKINIKKGENIKFILINETMMNHPIHLHGHFFRVLNGQGDYSPLKHTVNVSPFETVEIEFEANEEKDWIFHCHNLYHMKLGMGGVIHYEGTEAYNNQANHDHSPEHGNTWFNATKVEGYSNFAKATTKFKRNDDNIILDARHNYKRNYETELVYEKFFSQFLGLYVGGKFERENNKISNRGIIGLSYTLPLLINADLRINTKGKVRFGLSNEHHLTDRMSFEWTWNTDKEYTLEVSYSINNQLYISGNYDSKEKFGIGVTLKF